MAKIINKQNFMIIILFSINFNNPVIFDWLIMEKIIA